MNVNPTNIYTPTQLTFGHYDKKHLFYERFRPLAITHNILNKIDWLPVICTISGIFRMIITSGLALFGRNKNVGLYDQTEETKTIRQWLKLEAIRGLVSFVGLGFLFIVPDLIFSLNQNERTIDLSKMINDKDRLSSKPNN